MEAQTPTKRRNKCWKTLLYVRTDIPPADPKRNHALQPLATLFVFFLAQIITATITEKGKGQRSFRTSPFHFARTSIRWKGHR